MSKFISLNFKYYKHKDRNELGHNVRVHKKVENSVPELVSNNIYFGNAIQAYHKIYDRVCESKGKQLQKNANTYIDAVLAFDRDQINSLINEMGRDGFNEAMTKTIKRYMIEFKKEFGFEPLSFQFHADEGHKCPETGEWKENYHAHLQFFNFDFETKRAPLREFVGKGGKSKCSKMQDLAGLVFSKLGFVRGISKEITKKEHLEKDEYIAKKVAEKVEKYQSLSVAVNELASKLNIIEKEAYERQLALESQNKEFDLADQSLKLLKAITSEAMTRNQDILKLAFHFDQMRKELGENEELKKELLNVWDKIPKEVSKEVEKHIDSLCYSQGVKPIFNNTLEPVKDVINSRLTTKFRI